MTALSALAARPRRALALAAALLLAGCGVKAPPRPPEKGPGRPAQPAPEKGP